MVKTKIHYNTNEVLKNHGCVVAEKESDEIKKLFKDYISWITKNYTGHIIDTNSRLVSIEYNVDLLNERLGNVEKDIKLIKKTEFKNGNIIVVREMSLTDAKKRILEYTDNHKDFDIEELHRKIGCNLETIVRVLDELKKEGRIKEVD